MTISASPRASSGHSDDPAGLSIYALGRFEVYASATGRPISGGYWAQRKVQSLFKVLLIADGHRLHRERVQDILWPDFDLDQATAALRRTLYRLRQALAASGNESDAIIRLDADILSIAPEAIAFYDADRFEEAAVRLLSHPAEVAAYEETLALYGGDLLPDDLYEDWAQQPRERLRGLAVAVMEALTERYVAAGQIPPAIARLQDLLRLDPTHENAHRSLMELYARAGRRDDALRQFQLCKAALQRELDAEPSPETLALYREIAAGSISAAWPQVAPREAMEPTPGVDMHTGNRQERTKRVPFVGRTRELRELRTIAQGARDGHGHVVAFAGEPGAGKSRLAREFSMQECCQGAEVYWGYCYEVSGALPYGPLAEILSRHIRRHSRAEILHAAGNHVGMLATLVNEIRVYASGNESVPSTTPETARLLLFEAVTSYLLRAAQQARPLILVFDDLHWADAATLQLLDYIARQIQDAPLLLLILYRDTEITSSQSLRTMLHNWRRNGLATLRSLPPFAPEDVRQLLAALLGGEVDRDIAERLHRRTEGNPFFTQELANALLESGTVQRQDQRWQWTAPEAVGLPESVRTTVEARVARLGDQAAATLRAAAALGTRFDTRLLTAVRRADGLSEDQVFNDIEAAVHAGLLHELPARASMSPHPVEDFAFSHDLIRESLYCGLLNVRRRRLHQHIAQVLEQLGDPDSRAETLAYHYEAAGEVTKAVDYLLRAARHAEALYAYETAITDYHAAIERLNCLPRTPENAERLRESWERLSAAQERAADMRGTLVSCAEALKLGGTPEQRTELYLRMAQIERALGNYDRMRQHCEDGLDDLKQQQRAGHDPGPVPAALLRKALAVSLYRQGRYDAAQAIGNEVLSRLTTANAVEHIPDAYYVLGEIYAHRGNLEQAASYHEHALELYQRLDDLFGLARSYSTLGTCYADMNDLDRAITYHHRSIELHRQIGNIRGIYTALNNLSYLLTYRAEYHKALECTHEALDMIRRTGDHFARISVINNIGQIHERLGNLEEALRCYQEVQDASADFDDVLLRWVITANMAAIHTMLGNLEEAERYADRAIAMAEATRSSFSMILAQRSLGNVALAREDYARARHAFMQCLTYAHNAQEALTEAHLGLAQCDLHDQAIDAAEEHARKALALATASDDPYQIARTQRILAQIATARGEWERAQALFEEAIAAHRRLGNAFEGGGRTIAMVSRWPPAGVRRHMRTCWRRVLSLPAVAQELIWMQ